MNLEIVERSSGWWIVGENGVEHYEPFDEIEDAIEKMARKMLEVARLYDKESPVFLAVSVSIVGQAFHISIHLNKTVLDSVSNLSFPSSTWTIGSTGTHGGNKKYIMSNLSQGVDTFIDEYMRVNGSAGK